MYHCERFMAFFTTTIGWSNCRASDGSPGRSMGGRADGRMRGCADARMGPKLFKHLATRASRPQTDEAEKPPDAGGTPAFPGLIATCARTL
jgi:hypothetical protein